MLEYIASTGGAAVSTLSFTNIPNTYDSLVLRGYCTATIAYEQEAQIQFNGDTNLSNYRRTAGGRYGLLSGYGWNSASGSLFTFVPGSGIPTYGGSIVSQVDMNIFAYRKTATVPGRPGMMSQGNYVSQNTNYNTVQFLYSTWWMGDNSVDVSSIQLQISNQNWGPQTKFHLYGRTEA